MNTIIHCVRSWTHPTHDFVFFLCSHIYGICVIRSLTYPTNYSSWASPSCFTLSLRQLWLAALRLALSSPPFISFLLECSSNSFLILEISLVLFPHWTFLNSYPCWQFHLPSLLSFLCAEKQYVYLREYYSCDASPWRSSPCSCPGIRVSNN